MSLLHEAASGLGSVLLPLAAALLLEELTCAGLVRLLLTPRARSRAETEPNLTPGKAKPAPKLGN